MQNFLFHFFPQYSFWPTCNVLLDGIFNLLSSIPFVVIKLCNDIILMCIPLEQYFTLAADSKELDDTRKGNLYAFY